MPPDALEIKKKSSMYLLVPRFIGTVKYAGSVEKAEKEGVCFSGMRKFTRKRQDCFKPECPVMRERVTEKGRVST